MRNILLVVMVALLLTGCKDEFSELEYPVLETQEVTDVSLAGATFNARWVTRGKSAITEYGFIVLSDTIRDTLSVAGDAVGDFKLRWSDDKKMVEHRSVRAYAKARGVVIISNPVIFSPKFEYDPVITNFSPKEGVDGTLVVLSATNINSIAGKNWVTLAGQSCTVVSVDENTITVKTPAMKFSGTAWFVLYNGMRKTTSSEGFLVKSPEIVSIEPSSVKQGALFTIKCGTNTDQGVKVILRTDSGYRLEPVVVERTDSTIVARAPVLWGMNDYVFNVEVISGQRNITTPIKLTVQNVWSQIAAPLMLINGLNGGFVYNNQAYAVDPMGNISVYSPQNNQWTWYNMNKLNGSHATSLYIVTGNTLHKIRSFDYHTFDINTKLWTRKQPLPFTYSFAGFIFINDIPFVFTNDGQVWKCDFSTATYTRMNDFPAEWGTQVSLFKDNNRIYAAPPARVWLYDEISDRWDLVRETNWGLSMQVFTLRDKGYGVREGSELREFFAGNYSWVNPQYLPFTYYDQKLVFLEIEDKAFILMPDKGIIYNP